MTTAPPTGDPLFRTADQVPLGRRFGLVDDTETKGPPSGVRVRPFGLRFATTTPAVETVDLSGIGYDPLLQLATEATGLPVFAKHSTGATSTRTSDGHQSMDSDTDHTED